MLTNFSLAHLAALAIAVVVTIVSYPPMWENIGAGLELPYRSGRFFLGHAAGTVLHRAWPIALLIAVIGSLLLFFTYGLIMPMAIAGGYIGGLVVCGGLGLFLRQPQRID